eukprot:CAMPEP_0114383096 /NCGR_PEP_ID=MMETSP0102-20121206/4523_1 /TAXON_ID=38822 ORGANISM="Pteridomonas danica, Strain PT" /NCGR_SAMPLE_ID=MMETSP0102 /ASSEMBLY_ACC=CAM_ASM_000212 /LENGTH=212 /DNA_ID=CAMNT_0001539067 /DNA_START=227 /DNA_END=861 /DNA_ORIENTATION=-
MESEEEAEIWLPLGECDELLPTRTCTSEIKPSSNPNDHILDSNVYNVSDEAQGKEQIQMMNQEALTDPITFTFSFTPFTKEGRKEELNDCNHLIELLNETTNASWSKSSSMMMNTQEKGKLYLDCLSSSNDQDSLRCSIMWSLSSHGLDHVVKWVDAVNTVSQSESSCSGSEPKSPDTISVNKLALLANRGQVASTSIQSSTTPTPLLDSDV